MDDEPLGGDARLSVVLHSGLHGYRDGPVEISRRQDDERVAATELQDHLLSDGPGLGSHGPAGAHTPGQRDRRHPAIGDDGRNLIGADQQRLQQAIGGSGPAEQVLEEQCGPRDARGVLEEADVADHDGRGDESGHLPQGEVPRHDGQHHADGLVGDQTQGRLDGDLLILQHRLGALGKPAKAGGALGHLALCLGEGLAHLGGHDVGDVGHLAFE